MDPFEVEDALVASTEFTRETEGEVGVFVVKSIITAFLGGTLLIGEGGSRSFLLVFSQSSIAAISSSSLMSIFMYY